MTPRRRGSSLIEVLTAMSATSVMTAVIVTALMVALRSADQHRAAWNRSQSVQRLCDQVRRDVHQATDAQGPGEDVLCTLTSEGAEIVYRAKGNVIQRTVIERGAVAHRESYRVAQPAHVDIGRPHGSQARLLRFVLDGNEGSGRGVARPVTIEAQVGREHRYSDGSRGAGEGETP